MYLLTYNRIALYNPVIVACWFHCKVIVHFVSQLLLWLARHILNTWIRQLPGSGQVVTAGYLDPVPGEIHCPSHLIFGYAVVSNISPAVTLGTSVAECLWAEITKSQLSLAAAVHKQTTLHRMKLSRSYYFRQLLHVGWLCINDIWPQQLTNRQISCLVAHSQNQSINQI